MNLTRTAVAQLRPGARARARRNLPEFVVAGVFAEHGGWRVVDADGTVRRLAERASVLVDVGGCQGQTDLLIPTGTEARR